VGRYDRAHEFTHRDVLDHRRNVIDQQGLTEQLDTNLAFQDALRELNAKLHVFRDGFVERMPEEQAP